MEHGLLPRGVVSGWSHPRRRPDCQTAALAEPPALPSAQPRDLLGCGHAAPARHSVCAPGQEAAHDGDPELGAGGLYSSASELANFLHFLINEDKFFSDSILRRDVLHQMLNPNVKNDLLPPWFMDLGMGFYSMKLDNGEPVWGHTGANPGSSTYLFFNPEIKIGAIVIANRFVDIRDLITWVFAEAFNELNDIPLKKLKKSWEQYSNKINGNDRNRRIVTIQVTPTALPPNSSVYVNGNHRFLGSWISKGIPLIKKNDGSWSKRFHFFDSTKIEFKVTRGSWYMQAVDNKGTDLVPYSLLVLNDTTLTISIENWKDIYSKEK